MYFLHTSYVDIGSQNLIDNVVDLQGIGECKLLRSYYEMRNAERLFLCKPLN